MTFMSLILKGYIRAEISIKDFKKLGVLVIYRTHLRS